MKKLLAILFATVCAATMSAFAGCITAGEPDTNPDNDTITNPDNDTITNPDNDTVTKPENNKTQIEQEYSICYAFTASSAVSQISGKTSVKDYLDALKSQGKINFEGSDGDYGFYITSVLGIGSRPVSSTENSYSGYDWAVYTTLTTIDGVIYSYDDTTFVYDGITFFKAAYGVSGLPCVDGQSYALVYEYSSMTW